MKIHSHEWNSIGDGRDVPNHEGCDLHRDAFRRLLEAVEPTPLDEAG